MMKAFLYMFIFLISIIGILFGLVPFIVGFSPDIPLHEHQSYRGVAITIVAISFIVSTISFLKLVKFQKKRKETS